MHTHIPTGWYINKILTNMGIHGCNAMQELEWRDNPMDCDTGMFERVHRTPHMTDIPPRLGLWDISVEENVVFHHQHHPGARTALCYHAFSILKFTHNHARLRVFMRAFRLGVFCVASFTWLMWCEYMHARCLPSFRPRTADS
jgi:hypothetical protein